MHQEYSRTLKTLPLEKLLEIITKWNYIPKWTKNNNNTVVIPITFDTSDTSILNSPIKRTFFLGNSSLLTQNNAPELYKDFLIKTQEALTLFKKQYTSVSFDFEVKSRLTNQERGVHIFLCYGQPTHSFQTTLTWPKAILTICMHPEAIFPIDYLHELTHAIIGNNDLTGLNYLPFYPEVVKAIANATECLSVIPYSFTPLLYQCNTLPSARIGALDNELAALIYDSNNYIKEQIPIYNNIDAFYLYAFLIGILSGLKYSQENLLKPYQATLCASLLYLPIAFFNKRIDSVDVEQLLIASLAFTFFQYLAQNQNNLIQLMLRPIYFGVFAKIAILTLIPIPYYLIFYEAILVFPALSLIVIQMTSNLLANVVCTSTTKGIQALQLASRKVTQCSNTFFSRTNETATHQQSLPRQSSLNEDKISMEDSTYKRNNINKFIISNRVQLNRSGAGYKLSA